MPQFEFERVRSHLAEAERLRQIVMQTHERRFNLDPAVNAAFGKLEIELSLVGSWIDKAELAVSVAKHTK